MIHTNWSCERGCKDLIALNIEAIRVYGTLYRLQCLYCGSKVKYKDADKLTSDQFARRFGFKLLVENAKTPLA